MFGDWTTTWKRKICRVLPDLQPAPTIMALGKGEKVEQHGKWGWWDPASGFKTIHPSLTHKDRTNVTGYIGRLTTQPFLDGHSKISKRLRHPPLQVPADEAMAPWGRFCHWDDHQFFAIVFFIVSYKRNTKNPSFEFI